MKRRYRVMSDGTVYRVFPGGVLGSFAFPDMASVFRVLDAINNDKWWLHA